MTPNRIVTSDDLEFLRLLLATPMEKPLLLRAEHIALHLDLAELLASIHDGGIFNRRAASLAKQWVAAAAARTIDG